MFSTNHNLWKKGSSPSPNIQTLQCCLDFSSEVWGRQKRPGIVCNAGGSQHQIANETSHSNVITSAFVLASLTYNHTHKTCVILHRQNTGRQAHQKKSSRLLWDWYHKVCFSQKCVSPSFPPLLGKQRQQISLLLCQSLRTTLGQPWDCPPEFPWTSLTFSFSAEGSGHCTSTCFCGNWWNDGFVRHCPGNQEKRAWGWAGGGGGAAEVWVGGRGHWTWRAHSWEDVRAEL